MSQQSTDASSGLFDVFANELVKAYGMQALESQLIDNSLAWLLKKQQQFSDDSYFDQLEKNAVYLRESATACNLAAAMYLFRGQPLLNSEEQVLEFVAMQKAVGQELAMLQLQFIRSGCEGCDIHNQHGKWENYRQMRRRDHGAYIEELEFACIYHQSLFVASQMFLTALLQSHDFAGNFKQHQIKELLDTAEQRTQIWTQMWMGLIRFPNIKFDSNNRPIVEALDRPTGKPYWQEIWGERYQTVARQMGVSVPKASIRSNRQQSTGQTGTPTTTQSDTQDKKKGWQFWKK